LIHFFNPQAGLISEDYPREDITLDELEAMRLSHLETKSQQEGAKFMNISQTTFHRILDKAHQKITRALVEGKSIRLVFGNNPTFKYGYGCMDCVHEFFPKIEMIKDINNLLPLDGVICSNPACNSPHIYHLLREVGEHKLKNTETCPDDN
jgi:predicted DNA-binding protein (UPF0251 family)